MEQYKKTFLRMQLVIGLVTSAAYLAFHQWALAGLFLVTMQVSALLGGMWATRLKRKVQGRSW